MFYAASEIVFWILLAAIVGGGIGYGLSQAKALRINKRLTQSRADAPMERELAIAWDTIEDLNRRLQVAHETIRDGSALRGGGPDELIEVGHAANTDAAASAGDAGTEDENKANTPTDADKDTVIDMSASRAAAASAEPTNGSKAAKPPAKKPAAKKATASKSTAGAKTKTPATKAAAPKTAAKPAAAKPAARKDNAPKATAAKAGAKKPIEPLSEDTVGKRLSERVASASIANQVDFTDGDA